MKASRSDDDALEALHDEVDRRVRELIRIHATRLNCARGCSRCCTDGLTVYEIEAERIRRHHPDLLDRGRPHPGDGCAFLDPAGACRVYADRPYVCRTQGLPLRWLEPPETEGVTIELRDICPLNEEGPPIEELPAEACWTLGAVEGRLAELQRRWRDGTMRRVPLRDLFRRSAP